MRKFEVAEWTLVRGCGSHHLCGKKGITFSVPFHGSCKMDRAKAAVSEFAAKTKADEAPEFMA